MFVDSFADDSVVLMKFECCRFHAAISAIVFVNCERESSWVRTKGRLKTDLASSHPI